ncbi:MAG: hypothetical protein ACFE96_05500 [Candidatus Hermodarchaeota archaeon]
MAIEFYWEPEISYIIPIALWVFTYIALIIWAKDTKKQGTHTKQINFLQIVGIFILAWYAIYFFLPSVRFTFPPPTTEIDLLIYNLVYFFYNFIPNLLFILLGIALMFYVNKNYALDNRKVIIGPILFLAGHVTFLFLQVSSFLLYYIVFPIWSEIYRIYIFADPIVMLLLIAGACLLLLFSIRLNRDFFNFFTSLLLASLIVSFLFEINYTSWYVYYWWGL